MKIYTESELLAMSPRERRMVVVESLDYAKMALLTDVWPDRNKGCHEHSHWDSPLSRAWVSVCEGLETVRNNPL